MLMIMRGSRSKDIVHTLGRFRHCSKSVSPGSIKKRKNDRRLHSLKEFTAIYVRSFSKEDMGGNTNPGLHGGGKKENLDYERLASIITGTSIAIESSKKEFWKAVAQQYFKMFAVDKKKVQKLRLAWRRNTGGIRDRVKKYPTTNDNGSHPQEQGNSSQSYENEEDPNDPLHKKHAQLKTVLRNCVHNTKDNDTSNNGGIDEFFGRVVGQAVITVYSEICSDNYQEQTASITKEQTTESSN